MEEILTKQQKYCKIMLLTGNPCYVAEGEEVLLWHTRTARTSAKIIRMDHREAVMSMMVTAIGLVTSLAMATIASMMDPPMIVSSTPTGRPQS